MSLAGDEDFADALVKQTTALLGKALVDIKRDIAEERNKRVALQTEVNSLKTENEQLKEKIRSLEENDVNQCNSKIEQIENRMKAVEGRNCHCNVTDQLTRAFTAAITEININTRIINDTYVTGGYDSNQVCTSQNVEETVSSTPIITGKRKDMPISSPNVFYQSKKSKTQEPTHTAT